MALNLKKRFSESLRGAKIIAAAGAASVLPLTGCAETQAGEAKAASEVKQTAEQSANIERFTKDGGPGGTVYSRAMIKSREQNVIGIAFITPAAEHSESYEVAVKMSALLNRYNIPHLIVYGIDDEAPSARVTGYVDGVRVTGTRYSGDIGVFSPSGFWNDLGHENGPVKTYLRAQESKKQTGNEVAVLSKG